jgi:hypothetical protein
MGRGGRCRRAGVGRKGWGWLRPTSALTTAWIKTLDASDTGNSPLGNGTLELVVTTVVQRSCPVLIYTQEVHFIY